MSNKDLYRWNSLESIPTMEMNIQINLDSRLRISFQIRAALMGIVQGVFILYIPVNAQSNSAFRTSFCMLFESANINGDVKM